MYINISNKILFISDNLETHIKPILLKIQPGPEKVRLSGDLSFSILRPRQ